MPASLTQLAVSAAVGDLVGNWSSLAQAGLTPTAAAAAAESGKTPCRICAPDGASPLRAADAS